MKKLLSLFLTILMIATISIPCFADGDENQSTAPGEWFYTDFGFPEEYVREDPQTLKSFGEKLWLPKAPYLPSAFFSLAELLPYELPDHEKNVEYFKNESPLILILDLSKNAVQYTCPEPFTTKNGITLTQAKVIDILRNDNGEQISVGDQIWVQENYFWYTDETGTDVFSSPYGAECKPMFSGTNYLVQATRVEQATKENVFSVGQYFWKTSDQDRTSMYHQYHVLRTQWLYCSFWEIDEYRYEVFAHFDLLETEDHGFEFKSALPIVVGAAAVVVVIVVLVVVIAVSKKDGTNKPSQAPAESADPNQG